MLIYFFASPQGMTLWWGHLGLIIFALLNLHRASQYYLFWITLLIGFFFASEPRFSLEYLLITSSCIAFASRPWWTNKPEKERKYILLALFIMLFMIHRTDYGLYERGSLLIWAPMFLSLYYTKKNKESLIVYFLSGIALSFSTKTTIVLAYLSQIAKFIKVRYLIMIGASMLIFSFIYIEKIHRFIQLSMLSRVFIWQSSIEGWLAKPIFGHGFATFAIDFPPFRAHNDFFGARLHQQIAHGHGFFTHYLFEQGLFGLALCVILMYLVYKHARVAFIPLLITAFLDATLMAFNQYILAALVLIPFLKANFAFAKLKPNWHQYAMPVAYSIAAIIFISSGVGHYYYSQGSFNNAIKWDKFNSLYHFSRGTDLLNSNIKESLKSLEQATELSPNISYFHGFLAAARLANRQFELADKSADQAILMDGPEPYWLIIKAFANYSHDKELFKELLTRALKRNPEIAKILKDPRYQANSYIGHSGSDARIHAFFRTGPVIALPLPYLHDDLPADIEETLEAAKLRPMPKKKERNRHKIDL